MRTYLIGALSCLLAFTSLASTAGAGTIVVPGGLANTEGNTNNAFPFGLDTEVSMRYQQVYDSAEFGTGSSLISQIVFRPDQSLLPTAWTISSIQINLSTTPKAVDALSLTFADNVGVDDTTVFSGSLALSTSATGPSGGPLDFDVIIALSTPFSYDPTAGNLLLDARVFSGASLSAVLVLDADITFGDGVSRVFTNLSTGSVGDPIGFQADSLGLVTRFATPEPAAALLLGLGLVCIAVAGRRRPA